MSGQRVCRNPQGNRPSLREQQHPPPEQGTSQRWRRQSLPGRLPQPSELPTLPDVPTTTELPRTPELPPLPTGFPSLPGGLVFGDGCEPVAVDAGETKP